MAEGVRAMASVVHVIPVGVGMLRCLSACGGTRGVTCVEVVESVEFQECPVASSGNANCASELIEEDGAGLCFVAGTHLAPGVCSTDLGQGLEEVMEGGGAFAMAPDDKAVNMAIILEALPNRTDTARVMVDAARGATFPRSTTYCTGLKPGDLIVVFIELACFEDTVAMNCRGANFNGCAASTGILKGRRGVS